jgi:hypothetical protein
VQIDPSTAAEIAAAARANYEAQQAAMVAGDADALGALLADSCAG